MQLTAEISLYPLNDDYIPVIKAFIRRLRDHEALTVVTNAMSTQLTGPYDAVLEAVGDELRRSVEEHGKQVLVCKLIPGELAITETPDI